MKLTRLETRFLLNFVLGECNRMHPYFKKQPGFGANLCDTNLNNLDGSVDRYERVMFPLSKKLQRADQKFYKKKKEATRQ